MNSKIHEPADKVLVPSISLQKHRCIVSKSCIISKPLSSSLSPSSLPQFPQSKRYRETDTDVLPTPKKTNSNSAECRTKFTDLIVDCLEYVFDNLELIDLLNIADLNANTKEAAGMVYKKRYSNHLVKMSGMDACTPLKQTDSEILIASIAICSKLLCTFGEFIERLQLEYISSNQVSTADWCDMKNLFDEKCAKHLFELKLVNCDKEMVTSIEKPMENVKKLRISCSHLGTCMELDKCFPAIQELELMHHDGGIQILRKFRSLRFLAMDTSANARLTTYDIETMIDSAPTIQVLSLSGGIDPRLLEYINENLHELKELYFREFRMKNRPWYKETFVFKKVEKLTVRTGYLGDLPEKIPFEFEALKEMSIITASLDRNWIEFVMKQRELEKLHLTAKIKDDDIDQIAHKLIKLREIDVVANLLSVEGLARFLKQCESMQKIRLTKYDPEMYDSICKLGGAKWHVVQDGQWAVILTKEPF